MLGLRIHRRRRENSEVKGNQKGFIERREIGVGSWSDHSGFRVDSGHLEAKIFSVRFGSVVVLLDLGSIVVFVLGSDNSDFRFFGLQCLESN